MYAVVYKNKVLVGPMSWNRGIFQGSLKKQGIDQTLPRVAPNDLPYIINDDAKIMAVEEVRPRINTMVEYHYGPLWEITESKAIANFQVVDNPIEFAKNNFKNLVSSERYKKEVTNIKINIQGIEITLDTSRDGRNFFTQKYLAMADNDTINWKFKEGWLTLTKNDLQLIVSSITTHVQSAFDWEKTINDQIDAATNKDELTTIEIVKKKENKVEKREIK
jgi:hypothetical protein